MIRRLYSVGESMAIIGFVVVFAAFAILLGGIWIGNLPALLRDISWLGIVVIGQAIVIISGEFDLSVGSVFAFVGLTFVLLMQLGSDPALALLVAMLCSFVIGYISGFVSWRLGLPSLLVTLGFLFVYRGLMAFFTKGFSVIIPDEIRGAFIIQLLGGKTFGFHNSIAFCAVLLAVFSVLLAWTRFGSHLYAVGGNVNSALVCGVRPGRTKIAAFIICSGLAGFAGIVAACTLSSVSPTTAESMEFEAIAAAVIGGCALRGGAGSAWGGIIGVATLMALKSGLILIGANIFTYQILLGLFLVGLIAVREVIPMVGAVR